MYSCPLQYSSAAEGADDMDGILRPDRYIEIVRLLLVHKDLDVFADAALLVDDAEAEAGMAAIDIGEEFVQGRTTRFDNRLFARV